MAIVLHALEELDRLLARRQPDVGLLPVRAVAAKRPCGAPCRARLATRTSATLTLNWLSTARLISILLAPRSTSKRDRCSLRPRSRVDFSVISGRRMMSCDPHCLRAPPPAAPSALSLEHHVRPVHHVVDVDRERVDRPCSSGCCATPARGSRCRARRRAAPCPRSRARRGCLRSSLVLWLVELEVARPPRSAPPATLLRERRLERVLLLADREVLSRSRAAPGRGRCRPCARSGCGCRPCGRGRCPSALQGFLPRAARPRRGSWSCACRARCAGEVGLHRLVDQVLLVRVAEDLVGEVDLAAPARCSSS